MPAMKRKSAGSGAPGGGVPKRARPASGTSAATAKPRKDGKSKDSKQKPSPEDQDRKAAATKAEKKARVQEKKEKKKPVLGLVKDVLTIWETMRPRDASAEQKRDLAAMITKKAAGKYRELAMNHASSRVVQAVLKHGTAEDRKAVWNDCSEHLVEMAQSPHGNFVVRKLIASADKDELSRILRAVKGSVVKLFRHPAGSAVMADLFDELSTTERNVMVSEFYGREYALFGTSAGEAGSLRSLSEAWPETEVRKRRSVMQSLIVGLQPIIEKGYVDPAAIHRLISEYCQLAPSDMLQDTVETLSGENVLRMVHTHDGARVGCMVVAYGTPKDRKKLVKSMKGHVLKMCLDEFAYIPLIMTLLRIDDTQLVRKVVIAEILGELEEVLGSKHGIKVVLSLLSADERHLPPHAVALLHPVPRTVLKSVANDAGDDDEDETEEQATEEVPLGVSKKDNDLRRRELLGHGKGSLSAALLAHCTQQAFELLRTAQGSDLVARLCTGATAEFLWEHDQPGLESCYSALAASFAPPAANVEGAAAVGPAPPQKTSLLEDYFASRALRRMVSDQSSAPGARLTQQVWNDVFSGRCATLLDSHAAKVIAALAEHAQAPLKAAVDAELGSHIGDAQSWLAKFAVKGGDDAKRKTKSSALKQS